jgi:hypothetical protein
VVNHAEVEGAWQRVANLPAAYAVCERFNQRDVVPLPRRREQA